MWSRHDSRAKETVADVIKIVLTEVVLTESVLQE